jgi:hypothetical protein
VSGDKIPDFDAKCGKCAKCVKMCNLRGVQIRDPQNVHFFTPPKTTPKKRSILGKTPKMRFCKNPSRGAQKCGESRQIIYCLDTRSGPQKWGFSDPPRNRGFWGGTAKHAFRANCAKHVFCTPCRNGGISGERHRGSRRFRGWLNDHECSEQNRCR